MQYSLTKSIGLLPAPRNGVALGFTRFQLVDPARKNPDGSDNRRFEVLAWYPASNMTRLENRKRYLDGHLLDNLKLLHSKFGREWVRSNISQVRTNSYIDVTVGGRAQYPVLIFSHDLGMLPEYHTALMEHLASEKYFVFAINHSGYSDEYLHECSETKHRRVVRVDSKLLKRYARGRLICEKFGQVKNVCVRNIVNRLGHKMLLQVAEKISSEYLSDRDHLISFLSSNGASNGISDKVHQLISGCIDVNAIGIIGHGIGGFGPPSNHLGKVRASVSLDPIDCNGSGSTKRLVITQREAQYVDDPLNVEWAPVKLVLPKSRLNPFTDWQFYTKSVSSESNVLFHETSGAVSRFFGEHLRHKAWSEFATAK